jgi:hypothetical protein
VGEVDKGAGGCYILRRRDGKMKNFLWGLLVGVLATFCFIYFGGADMLVKMSSEGRAPEHGMKKVEERVQEKIKDRLDSETVKEK